MTQLTGRTDVQLRRAEASTCWCWQERGAQGKEERRDPGGAAVVGGGNRQELSVLQLQCRLEAAFWTGLLAVHGGVTEQGTHGSQGWCRGSLPVLSVHMGT